MVKAVLFDVDGTLVDSNDAHARAWVEAFAEAGIRVSYDVKAARAAGVRVNALRSGGWTDEDLRGAEAVYDDPADLLAHLDESPLSVRSPR